MAYVQETHPERRKPPIAGRPSLILAPESCMQRTNPGGYVLILRQKPSDVKPFPAPIRPICGVIGPLGGHFGSGTGKVCGLSKARRP